MECPGATLSFLYSLSSLFLLIITGVGFLIHVYSTSYMKEEKAEHFGRYFSYLNLFVFSMLLLVMGGNFVIMFIGWEGVGLCSYLLIGYWFKNQEFNSNDEEAHFSESNSSKNNLNYQRSTSESKSSNFHFNDSNDHNSSSNDTNLGMFTFLGFEFIAEMCNRLENLTIAITIT